MPLLKKFLPLAIVIAIFLALFWARYVQAAWIVDKDPPDTTSITVTCGGTSIADGGECNATTANITITCGDIPAVNFSGCYRIHYSLTGTFPYTTCQVIDETGRTFGLCNPVQTSLTQTYTHSFTMGTTQSSVIVRACSSDGAGNKEWTDADSSNVPDTGDTIIGLCSAFSFEFTAVGGWWQVEDADIMASGGGIQSLIPQGCSGSCKPYLNLEDGGTPADYPGVTSYGSGTANFGPGGQVARDANERWLANSGYAGRKYDFNYFFKFAPKTGTGADDMEVIDCTGGCDISGGNLQAKATSNGKVKFVHFKGGNLTVKTDGAGFQNTAKLFIFVDGNLNIERTITVKNDESFFGAAVKGNINISGDTYDSNKTKPALEGLYMADGVINTGTKQPGANDKFLYVRGALIGWGGINFQRNLGDVANENDPGEKIEYAPDLLFSFPRQLLREGLVWREIAP